MVQGAARCPRSECDYCSKTYKTLSSPPSRPQYCSAACRSAAYRARLGQAVPTITGREPAELVPATTVDNYNDEDFEAMRKLLAELEERDKGVDEQPAEKR